MTLHCSRNPSRRYLASRLVDLEAFRGGIDGDVCVALEEFQLLSSRCACARIYNCPQLCLLLFDPFRSVIGFSSAWNARVFPVDWMCCDFWRFLGTKLFSACIVGDFRKFGRPSRLCVKKLAMFLLRFCGENKESSQDESAHIHCHFCELFVL